MADDDFNDFDPPPIEDELEKIEQKFPRPIPKRLLPNAWASGRTKNVDPPRPPLRALKMKSDELRRAVRGGNPMDWVDIHDRFIDLWGEARMVVWRAKHTAQSMKTKDPFSDKNVRGFISDDKLVIEAINCTRGVLDSIVKLRKDMGQETQGIPRFVTERIERALRAYPEALNALLKDLASEVERDAERD